MIYQSGSGRSRLPGANCFLLKKGCRQASPVRGGSQRTKTGSISWSSTENSNNPNNAWNVNFDNGNGINNNKNNTNNVRAVLAFSIKTLR